MRVVVDNTTYLVTWAHKVYSTSPAPCEHLKVFPNDFRPMTCCHITKIEGEKKIEVANGLAFLSSGDRYVRKVGRKVSLTDALMVLFPSVILVATLVEPDKDAFKVLEKHYEARKAFWQAFYHMQNDNW